jgi:arginase
VMLGHGPLSWLEALGPSPLLPPEALVIAGYRDIVEAQGLGSLLPEDIPELLAPDVEAVRADPAGTGSDAGTRASEGGRPVWLHLDVDVLDEAEFPATDYLMPGGLTLAEVTELIRSAAATVDLVGASVACYNPTKDPDGRHGRALVDLLGAALSPRV